MKFTLVEYLPFQFLGAPELRLYMFTLSFRDREQEEKYKRFYYNTKSNINTVEQALIIFLVSL